MSKDKGFMEIGKRLHSVRGQTDQRGFSRLVDVSQQAISNYERGNLPGSWAFLRRLNEELNVNLNWLFSGQGFKDYRAGTPYAALADNRPPEWPHAFLRQVAFQDTHLLERLLGLYFLYLFTEPADAKTRLMADFQAIVDLARRELESSEAASGEKLLVAALDALATDNRLRAVESLIALGEHMERGGGGSSPSDARRAYLAALNLARMQGLRGEEIEAARRAGRTYGKEGRWREAERLFDEVVSGFAEPNVEDGLPEAGAPEPGVTPATAARALLGYGHLAKHKGELSTASARYRAALRWASLGEDAALQARIHLDLACVSYREGEWQPALDFLARGRALAKKAADLGLVRRHHVLEALVQRGSGNLDAAAASLRALAQQAEAAKDGALLTTASVNLAQVLLDRGSHDEAEQLLRRTAAAAEAHGGDRNLALRRILAARLASARGEIAAARTGFLGALRFARDRGLTREFDQAMAAFEKALESTEVAGAKAR